jgi:hypothetical protein
VSPPDPLEQRFFTAGDALAAQTSQFEGVEVEVRRRRVTALAVTAVILAAIALLLGFALPAPGEDGPPKAVIESR